MQKVKRSKAIGLDIGQTSAKVMSLVRSGSKAVIKRAEIFRLRDEGLLGDDEAEQLKAIGDWMKELKLSSEKIVLGLPQYMTTTQVSDFMANVKGPELEKMVALETSQLSGISDDAFIHDYAVMPPGNGRVNPVLIGICREANVDDFVGRAVDVSLQMEDVAMNGLALANAFLYLHPETMKKPGIHVALDIGTETTTMAVLSEGQILYIGSMMFGGMNVSQEITKQLLLTPDEAERRKLKGDIDWKALCEQAKAETPVILSNDLSHAAEGEAPAEEQPEAASEEPEAPEAEPAADESAAEEADEVGELNGEEEMLRRLAALTGEDQGPEEIDENAPKPLPLLDLNAGGENAPAEDANQDDKVSLSLPKLPTLKLPTLNPQNTEEAPASGEAPALAPAAEEKALENVAVPVLEAAPPSLICFRTMIRELENCLEHWRSSEKEELVNQPIVGIWLCGGGALLEMTSAFLSYSEKCTVELLGPRLEKGGPAAVEYTIAFGLGLQGLGLAPLPLSMSPPILKWNQKKERRGSCLVAAFLLVFLFVFGWMYWTYESLGREIVNMEAETEKLKDNVKQITKLDNLKSSYSQTLLQVLPIVDSASRTQTFLTVLDRLQQAVRNKNLPDCNNWCVYVADSVSFNEYNNDKGEKKTATATLPVGMGRRGRGMMMREQPDSTVDNSVDSLKQAWDEMKQAEAENKDVTSVSPLNRFYVVGIIMSKKDNHNLLEREIMLNLLENDNEEKEAEKEKEASQSFFSEVQVMNEDERAKCKNRSVIDWERCFANMKTSEAFKEYDHKSFFLRLTLREPTVMPPPENPLNGSSKKSKKDKKK